MSENIKVGVIGAGAWGTAIAKVIAEKGIPVTLWSFESEVAGEINSSHTNSPYLMGIELPPNLKATTDLTETVKGHDYLLIATPSPFILDTIKQLISLDEIMEGTITIGILTKGFLRTNKGIQLITDALENYLPGSYKGNLVYISGPSHAEEVARGKITGLISASANGKNSIKFRELLSGGKLIVFSSFDVVGVQVSAALKNVIAIAFGMFDALKKLSPNFGDNTESLLLAAGLNEIQSLGTFLGASHPETFTSIAGVGDLDVTCRSVYGRNRRFGREIIINQRLKKYKNIDDLIANINEIGYLPEGVHATYQVHELSKEMKNKPTICLGMYNILNKTAAPMEEVERILKGITRGSGFDFLDNRD